MAWRAWTELPDAHFCLLSPLTLLTPPLHRPALFAPKLSGTDELSPARSCKLWSTGSVASIYLSLRKHSFSQLSYLSIPSQDQTDYSQEQTLISIIPPHHITPHHTTHTDKMSGMLTFDLSNKDEVSDAFWDELLVMGSHFDTLRKDSAFVCNIIYF